MKTGFRQEAMGYRYLRVICLFSCFVVILNMMTFEKLYRRGAWAPSFNDRP
jgi:hypothetical protein